MMSRWDDAGWDSRLGDSGRSTMRVSIGRQGFRVVAAPQEDGSWVAVAGPSWCITWSDDGFVTRSEALAAGINAVVGSHDRSVEASHRISRMLRNLDRSDE